MSSHDNEWNPTNSDGNCFNFCIQNNFRWEFTCNKCSKLFDSEQACQQHVNDMHTEFKCVICFKYYRTSIDLRNHIKYSHPKKEYRCSSCFEIFKYKRFLLDHEQKCK